LNGVTVSFGSGEVVGTGTGVVSYADTPQAMLDAGQYRIPAYKYTVMWATVDGNMDQKKLYLGVIGQSLHFPSSYNSQAASSIRRSVSSINFCCWSSPV
jgi:negative regulator of replication initiation